jgi:hypothetical protein
MRVFWIGIGLIASVILVVIPYIESKGCKDRWAEFKLEGIWNYQTRCMVQVGGALIREEYVTIAPKR